MQSFFVLIFSIIAPAIFPKPFSPPLALQRWLQNFKLHGGEEEEEEAALIAQTSPDLAPPLLGAVIVAGARLHVAALREQESESHDTHLPPFLPPRAIQQQLVSVSRSRGGTPREGCLL